MRTLGIEQEGPAVAASSREAQQGGLEGDEIARILIVGGDLREHERMRALFGDRGARPAQRRFAFDSTHDARQALERVRDSLDAEQPYRVACISGRISHEWDGADLCHRLLQLDEHLEMILGVPSSLSSWEEIATRFEMSDRVCLVEWPCRQAAQIRLLIRTLSEKWRASRAEEERIGELEQAIATRTVELEATHGQLCQEIAERTRVEEELRRAQRLHALGRMAAGLGHEINNPLSFVVQGIEAAQMELEDTIEPYPDDPYLQAGAQAVERLLETALVGADRIGRIVRNIKLVAHPVDSTAESTDVREALQLALDMIRPKLPQDIEVVSELGEVPRVWCKRIEIEQVFMNILQNAVHAIEEAEDARAEIRLRLYRHGDSVAIDISDTGRGIPRQHLDIIFDPFFTTKSAGRGTGLGLSVCHAIVSGIGGDIRVTSEVGAGTTVTIVLPGMDMDGIRPDANTQLQSVELVEVVEPTIPQVLVVDDEPLIRRVVKHALCDYQIVEACDGQEALTLCLAQSFDVILCDIMMPNVNGMEFYQRMAELMPGSEEYIIFFTAGTQIEEVRDFLENVDNDCLEKPIERRRLQQYVADTLARRRA